ncbi:MAG TPA: hypothetical protein VGJ17_06385 [Candidatus Limnocylindrales bacterium]
MDHSIAAKYAARPAAHFVRPSTRVRERRLGLRPSSSFNAPTPHATVVRGQEVAPLTRIRAEWRAIRPAVPGRRAGGRPRPAVIMQWARSGRAGSPRPGASSAPWQG